MNILQISPQVPFPPNDGGRIGIHGILTSLSALGHQIHFVTYAKEWSVSDAEINIRPYATPHVINHHPQHTIFGGIRNLFSSIPYNIEKFHRFDILRTIQKIITNESIDVVHIDHLHMGWIVHWLKANTRIPVVLRQHNLEMRIMKRFADRQDNQIIRWYANWQFQRFIRYEPEICRMMDAVAMISESDESELLDLDPMINTIVIPGGVNSEFLDRPLSSPSGNTFIHLGTMDWTPNKDSLESFIHNILPAIIEEMPDFKLLAVGKGTEQISVPDHLKSYINLAGFIPDLWNEIKTARGLLVPLRIGGGIRVKILEMMAGGLPVIASPVGLEGIHAKDGESVLVATKTDEWISSLRLISENEEFRQQLIVNARKFIIQNHTWEQVGKQFEALYLSLIKR